jgi:hypothetical protein
MAPPILAEQVSVTGVIRNILNNYPFSVGIFREFLQNSDDAKAPEQVGSSSPAILIDGADC